MPNTQKTGATQPIEKYSWRQFYVITQLVGNIKSFMNPLYQSHLPWHIWFSVCSVRQSGTCLTDRVENSRQEQEKPKTDLRRPET